MSVAAAQIEAVSAAALPQAAVPAPGGGAAVLGGARGALSAADLAELVAAFSEVTGRLQATHEALRSEVARLEGELTEARSRLRRAEQLAALGEMAAGIAHEIRNPLSSIKLYARMLVDDLPDRPTEQGTARKIASSVDRLNAVVGDVLMFSREMRVKRVEVSAADLLDHAAEDCAQLLESGRVRLERRHAGVGLGADVRVECDPHLIHQALVNVIRNACEALAEGGAGRGGPAVRLGVERRSVLDEQGRRRSMTALLVEDNGPGIPEDVLGRVFNPFFTTRETGTGLGLAIVHRIMDAHDGRVVLKSGDQGKGRGRGTTVELLLPEMRELESQGVAA
ncbi:MAG: hypothetical protein IBJ11_10150 [Phycisphaerales bacterium]|nr:hypothetical protein [Phycisphaerales bacterium]